MSTETAEQAHLFTTAEPKPSDRAITEDLMGRLKRHYIKPGAPFPGGIFLPEVGWNGGTGTTRCDAIYVGFTGTSGRLLVGHEVKASRSDWLTELSKPGKADAWADQCHEWWLVAAPGIVHDGELPDGWGLMVPGRSKTRMRVVTPARRKPGTYAPSWDATRSIMARQDTLRESTIREAVDKSDRDSYEQFEKRVATEVERRMQRQGDVTAIRDELARVRKALGVEVLPSGGSAWGDRVTEDTLRDLAELLREHRTVQAAVQQLTGIYGDGLFERMRRALDDLQGARSDLMAAPTAARQVQW